MIDITQQNINREEFLNFELGIKISALYSKVKIFLEANPLDLSYGNAIDESGTSTSSEILGNLIALISELRTFDSIAADLYLDKLRQLKFLLDSIEEFNNQMLQLEDLIGRKKKILNKIFDIYQIVINLYEFRELDLAENLLGKLSFILKANDQKAYAITKDEFRWDLFLLEFTLVEVYLNNDELITDTTLEDINLWLRRFYAFRELISLQTQVRLTMFLKEIVGKKIDILDDSEVIFKLSEQYRSFSESLRTDREILKRRSSVENDIVKLISQINESNTLNIDYIEIKKLIDDLLKLLEINDQGFILELRSELLEYLGEISRKFDTLSDSPRNRKRKLYLNKLISLLNEI